MAITQTTIHVTEDTTVSSRTDYNDQTTKWTYEPFYATRLKVDDQEILLFVRDDKRKELANALLEMFNGLMAPEREQLEREMHVESVGSISKGVKHIKYLNDV